MNAKKELEIGQRVQYVSGGNWKPFGKITDKQPAITMNGAILSGARYKVAWEDGEESGWLSANDLKQTSGE